MSKRLDAYLILGCQGNSTEDGFINCNSVANPILDLSSLEEADYERVLHFFENACNLFDRTMYNYNMVSNTLNMLHRDYGVITPTMLYKIQQYLRMHKICGVYLMLILKEDFEL